LRSALLGCLERREPGSPVPGRLRDSRGEGVRTVKKLLLLALAGLGVFAVWRKVQADRAELDLWTEATTSDE
jgi:hypothetical protein